MVKQQHGSHMNNPNDLHKISAEIGGLKASVEMMMKMWERQEAAATLGRRALHDKFESFRMEATAQLQTLGLRVDRVVDTMKGIEPAVQSFKDEKLREEGSKRLGLKLYAALTAAAGAIGWGAHEFFLWWKPH